MDPCRSALEAAGEVAELVVNLMHYFVVPVGAQQASGDLVLVLR